MTRGPTSDASVTAAPKHPISRALLHDDQGRFHVPSVKMIRLRRPKAPSTNEETFQVPLREQGKNLRSPLAHDANSLT